MIDENFDAKVKRRERLALALRENLKRRKMQLRARAAYDKNDARDAQEKN